MLTIGIGESFGEVRHRIVHSQEAYRQMRFIGLRLRILRRLLLGSELLFLLIVDGVLHRFLYHPGIHHAVQIALARSGIAHHKRVHVELRFLAVDQHLHVRCQRSDGRTRHRQYRHRHLRTRSLDAFSNALRQSRLRNALVVEEFVLLLRFFECRKDVIVIVIVIVGIAKQVLLQFSQHIPQTLRHLRSLLAESRIDALHLLIVRKTIIARNHLVQRFTVKPSNVTQIDRQLKRQHIAVRLHRCLPIVVQLPPLLDDLIVRDAEVVQVLKGRHSGG